MADLGAEVIKVEPPEGDITRRYGPFPGNQPDPEKSGLFIYLNANKRGVTLDLTQGKRSRLDAFAAERTRIYWCITSRRRNATASVWPARNSQWRSLL